MINRIKQKLNKDFTILPNEVFNGSLTAKAIGIFAYLCSKDDDWVFYQTEIEQHFKMGITAVSTALKELENNGLLLRYRERKSGKLGNMIYILFPNEDDYNYIGKTYVRKSNIGNSNIGKSKANNRDNTNREEKKRDSNNREEKNKQKEKPKNETLPPELNIEAFNMWIEYKGKSYSKQGKTIAINKLIEHSKNIQLQMVETSIMNNWKGLFEIKENNQPKLTPYTDLSQVDYGDVENTAF